VCTQQGGATWAAEINRMRCHRVMDMTCSLRITHTYTNLFYLIITCLQRYSKLLRSPTRISLGTTGTGFTMPDALPVTKVRILKH